MNGGRRPGAGRKPGSANQKTRAIADRAMAEGISPLEVMLNIMRDQWKLYQQDTTNTAVAQAAIAAARDCAAFVHPRLSPIDAPIHVGPLEGALPDQARAVVDAMSMGRIAPSSAADAMQTLVGMARLIENSELTKRVELLEAGR